MRTKRDPHAMRLRRGCDVGDGDNSVVQPLRAGVVAEPRLQPTENNPFRNNLVLCFGQPQKYF